MLANQSSRLLYSSIATPEPPIKGCIFYSTSCSDYFLCKPGKITMMPLYIMEPETAAEVHSAGPVQRSCQQPTVAAVAAAA